MFSVDSFFFFTSFQNEIVIQETGHPKVSFSRSLPQSHEDTRLNGFYCPLKKPLFLQCHSLCCQLDTLTFQHQVTFFLSSSLHFFSNFICLTVFPFTLTRVIITDLFLITIIDRFWSLRIKMSREDFY